MKRLHSLFSSFAASKAGSVPTLFALSVVSIGLAAGMAIDFTRMVHTKSIMNDALDAAVLAAGNELVETGTVNAELRQKFEDFFYANIENRIGIASKIEISEFTADASTGEIRANATAEIETTLMKLAGHQTMNLDTGVEAKFSNKPIEIAFALDVTGSMGVEGKLGALKRASRAAIDILLPNSNTNGVRIALVPYAASVNAGRWADRASNNATAGRNRKCVTERALETYTDASFRVDPVSADSRANCPSLSIRPLTNRKGALKRDISNLRAGGATAGHLGIAWSYYALSENWTRLWPNASDPQPYSRSVQKVALLMTDGSFNTAYNGVSSTEAALRTCAEMKTVKNGNPGIIIYSIAFKAPGDAQQLLKACANEDTESTNYYYSADDDAALNRAFKEIAESIKKLRITG